MNSNSLFSFLNKKLRTDTRYLVKGGSWLSLYRGVSVLTGIGLAVAFANLIAPDVYGTYKYVIAVGGFLTAFSLTGMSVALKVSSAKNFDGSLLQGYFSSIRWSVFIVLGALSVSAYYFLQGNNTLSIAVLLAGLFKPLMNAGLLYSTFLEGKTEFIKKSLFGIIHAAGTFCIMLPTLFLTSNIIAILSVYFLSNAVIHSALFFYTQKKMVENTNTDKGLTSYSKHLSIMTVLGKVSMQIDKILLFQHIGAVQLAVYAFARTPISELQEINTTLKKLIFPKLATKEIGEIKRKLPSKVLFIFIVALLIMVSYVLAAPYLFEFFFPKYTDAVIYTQVMSLGLLFFPRMPYMQTLLAHKCTKALYVIKTITPIARIASLLILVPLYGIWGAIISLLLAEVIMTILVLHFYLKLQT